MEFTEDDKKKIKIASIIIGISIIISIVSLFVDNNGSSKMNNIAKELGENYYKSSLYDTFKTNGTSLLSIFKDDGYKVNLQTLLEDNKDYVSYFVSDDKICDLENSYIIIYPKKPYKEGNYKVKTYLDCE